MGISYHSTTRLPLTILCSRNNVVSSHIYEPRHEKTGFCICENKGADQLRGNREADQRLCFRYTDRIVQSIYFLNTKFQASSHLLWLYSPVCVGPGRKPRRPVFSQRGSYGTMSWVSSEDFSSSFTEIVTRGNQGEGSEIAQSERVQFSVYLCLSQMSVIYRQSD